MQSQVGQRKRRGATREWTTVKKCSSKEDSDVWMAENGGSWTYDSDNSSNKFTDQYTNVIHQCDQFNCKAGMRIRYLIDLSVASKAWIKTTGEHMPATFPARALRESWTSSANTRSC
uniref:Uncharacterized protein n=1 Tax=Ditylenchus dipsaci TaxID=166011 RepID=A0A915DH23_9BILA